MATESKTFVTATQGWVLNRIQELKNFVLDVKGSIIEVIQSLARIEQEDVNKITQKLAQLSDKVVTGGLRVDGDAEVTGAVKVSGAVTSSGVVSAGPIVTSDPAGLIVHTPGRLPTGLNSTTLSLINERGKMARIFMRGDKLYYDYEYDKIYTFFEPSTGASLRYLHRGSTPLRQIVETAQQYPTDLERMNYLEEWFNKPEAEGEHKAARLFNQTVKECFPATGVSFMIPESMLFEVPELWKINSIKLVDNAGHAMKTLKSFHDQNVKKIFINFPLVRSVMEDQAQAAPFRREPGPEEVPAVDRYTSFPVALQHVADFENGYYEVTDPDAVFRASDSEGLIPNVILRLNEFPKDRVSVIYFDVGHV